MWHWRLNRKCILIVIIFHNITVFIKHLDFLQKQLWKKNWGKPGKCFHPNFINQRKERKTYHDVHRGVFIHCGMCKAVINVCCHFKTRFNIIDSCRFVIALPTESLEMFKNRFEEAAFYFQSISVIFHRCIYKHARSECAEGYFSSLLCH